MTVEEQIFAYKELRNNGQVFVVDNYEDADRIISALEKQIAKEPIKKHREHGGDTLLCPTCGEDIYTDTGDSYVDYPMNYCDNCGQKISYEV